METAASRTPRYRVASKTITVQLINNNTSVLKAQSVVDPTKISILILCVCVSESKGDGGVSPYKITHEIAL